MATGLKKKYINMAKKAGGTAKTLFKRAWKLQKRKAKSAASLKRKKVLKKVSKKVRAKKRKPITKRKGAVKMAKARKKTAAKSPARRRRMRGLFTPKTQKVLVNGVLIGGSAVGTTWAVNMIPGLVTQPSWMRSLIQAGIGLGGMTFVRDAMLKKIFVGSIVGAAITLIIPLLPEGAKIFGGARPFTDEEMEELTTDNRAGKPYTIAGRPARIMGGYSRGGRDYTKNF